MKKTILVAIDLTHKDLQGSILKKANQLASLDDASLIVTSIIPDFGMSIVSTYFEKDAKKKAKQEAKKQLSLLTQRVLGDTRVRHLIGYGNAYEEILLQAEKHRVDLIVIGAHKPVLSDYLLGTTASRVIRHSTCSVFVVRADRDHS